MAENDVPVRIYHTPTIRFYPARGKLSPIEYFGEKEDVDQYITFIQNEGPEDPKLKPISRKNTPAAGEIQGTDDIKQDVHTLESKK